MDSILSNRVYGLCGFGAWFSCDYYSRLKDRVEVPLFCGIFGCSVNWGKSNRESNVQMNESGIKVIVILVSKNAKWTFLS